VLTLHAVSLKDQVREVESNVSYICQSVGCINFTIPLLHYINISSYGNPLLCVKIST